MAVLPFGWRKDQSIINPVVVVRFSTGFNLDATSSRVSKDELVEVAGERHETEGDEYPVADDCVDGVNKPSAAAWRISKLSSSSSLRYNGPYNPMKTR